MICKECNKDMKRGQGDGFTFDFTQGGGLKMLDDEDIVRMTIVYKDGSMTILVRDGNVMRIERRQK